MALITRRYMHDVGKGSNLDLILRGGIGAINRFADVIGHGLELLAIALSTGEDNSAAIRAQAKEIRATREALQAAVDRQQPKETKNNG